MGRETGIRTMAVAAAAAAAAADVVVVVVVVVVGVAEKAGVPTEAEYSQRPPSGP